MDKAILKKFAIESRKDLMQKIESKIKLFYVDETFSKQQNGDVYVLSNEKHTLSLSKEEYEKRELLIKRINELGIEQVIEEAAYTWFNRIVAIRYMEINDYLPLTKDNQSLGIRVLSSKDNTPDPEIMKFTNLTNPELDIDFKKEKYIELKDDAEKYKYVLLLVCKKLGKVIPQVFDGITDYIDILIPDNLLNESGYITKLLNDVPEDNYNEVEIIGWLYQYYNQTEKDRVMSDKKTYEKTDIPYATQLFTPDWIVKYMVENGLGKYWLEHGGDKNLIKNWNYYIEEQKLENKPEMSPEDITVLDPCCGSGHILVYAFDVLYQIYSSRGYNKQDIPEKIIKHNLYGLDIDDRAGQLSILSILLKAREKDKNIFNKNLSNSLNIASIKESSKSNYDLVEYLNLEQNKINCNELLAIYENAKEKGSLEFAISDDLSQLKSEIDNNETIFGIELKNKILPLIKQNEILNKKYDVVITNPPYLSNSNMSSKLKKYVQDKFTSAKYDLFSSFIKRNLDFIKNDGIVAMITMQVWMFTSSFEEFRKYLLENVAFDSLIQIGFNTFPELNSKFALGVAFTMTKNNPGKEGIYYDLNVANLSADKEQVYLQQKLNKEYFISKNDRYLNIDGTPIAYWVSDNIFKIFKDNKKINDYSIPRQGMATTDNKVFLRHWFEVDINNIKFGTKNREEAKESKMKWFPYNKGGNYRKWYGNNDYIVNYYNDGEQLINLVKEKYPKISDPEFVIKNRNFYFKKGITWSFVNLVFGCRYFSDGFVFDVGGSSVFPDEDLIFYMIAFLNSKLSNEFLKILNPTLNFQVGNVGSLPFIIDKDKINDINELVRRNIELSKNEWDLKESSYDFKTMALIGNNTKYIKESIQKVINQEKNNFIEMKNNEEKINEIFFDIYNIYEFKKEIDDKYISYNIPNEKELVISLISYAVGCMFGRYSLDREGIICSGDSFDEKNYTTFKADIDNIIPITDEAYFADDIVSRFKDFIEVVYSKESLNANLDFIAEILGKKGTETSEETIRRYFLNDFYSDHIKMYQKKPIYWLFDSGKKNGFKALIYMHRYNENTVPKIRLDYLHRVQNTYDKLLADVNYKLTTELSVSDKKIAQNRQAVLNAKLQEITAYDEKIAHIANQRINIDLDDGVTTNYDKFKDILAKIK